MNETVWRLLFRKPCWGNGLRLHARNSRTSESTIIFSRVHLWSAWWAMTVPDFPSSIHPSIHPSIQFINSPLINRCWVAVAADKPEYARHPTPQQCFTAPCGGPWGVPRPDEICNPPSEYYIGISPQCPEKNSKGRCLIKGNEIRCLNHFSWLHSRQLSNGS